MVNYFILNKTSDSQQLFNLNGTTTFILPANNIDYYNNCGLFESGLIDWSKQFCSKDRIFLDIGSHTGTYAISLADHSAGVYAFEPQRMTYYALCGSVALSNKTNIHCINSGLGSTEQFGPMELNIISQDGGGSTLMPVDGILNKEIVNIITLDSLHLTNIGFIKMDIEGNEINAIKGGLETLKNSGYPPILFEANNPSASGDLFNLLTSISYRIVPVTGANNMFLACH